MDETLQNRFQDRDFQNSSFRVYTTLDMNLQRDAVEAVRIGIQETDQQWKRRSKQYGTNEMPLAQAALVALDAQTGEVKALVGGRATGSVNSIMPPRSASRDRPSSRSCTPLRSALALAEGGSALTAASTVEDEPTTFYFHGKALRSGGSRSGIRRRRSRCATRWRIRSTFPR